MAEKQELDEVDRLLQSLNRPAVKTFMCPDGGIIDCVEIDKQLAFDHPLLKNHKLQLRPSCEPTYEGDTEKSEARVSKPTMLASTWCECPEGTIPIRRVTREDVLRAGSIERFMRFGKMPPGYCSPSLALAALQKEQQGETSAQGAEPTMNAKDPEAQ